MGKAGGLAGGGGVSPFSLAADSGVFPGMYQVLRLSSHVRYRCKVHMPCSAPVSREEVILKKSRVRMKFLTACVGTRISHSGTRMFSSGRKRRRWEMTANKIGKES